MGKIYHTNANKKEVGMTSLYQTKWTSDQRKLLGIN